MKNVGVSPCCKCKSLMVYLKQVTDELSLAHLIVFFTTTGVNTMKVTHTQKRYLIRTK